MMAGLVGITATDVAAAKAQAAMYRFDGPVVFVKDRRGYVGAVFKLDRPLPKSGRGVGGAATLRDVVNDRPIGSLGRNCYESALNFAPKWGQYGNRYTLRIRLADGSSIRKSGVMYKASSGYFLNEGTGLRKDPKVMRRVICNSR